MLFNKKKRTDAEGNAIFDEDAVFEKTRDLRGAALLIVNIVACAFSVFQLYAAGLGTLPPNVFRAIHLGLGLFLTFLLYPVSKKHVGTKIPVYDMFFAILATLPNLYICLQFKQLAERAGRLTTLDLIMGIILILLLFEAGRRVAGPVLTGIAAVFVLYALLGNYIPGVLHHRGASITTLVRHMYLTTDAIYGTALGACASFIFLFILLGSILTQIGAGEVLIKLALSVCGRFRGGPAKAAVVASGLFGSISGSGLANVATTGAFTIPMMKKTGYKPEFAGAVEAAASTAGQIMPPIMGSVAFIMAEFLGVSYLKVCLAAIVPAVLYYVCVFFAVDQEARKNGLRGIPKEELPNAKEVLKEGGYLLLPLVLIIVVLALGMSANRAGCLAVLVSIALSFVKKESALTPKKLFIALANGAKGVLGVLVPCAVVGFIVGGFSLSGLGAKMASIVLMFSDGHMLLALLLTAVTSLVLGMGVPTTANYIIMTMITVPAVVSMGVTPIAAHLFCFYFGIISDLTPPVALAALTGAGIAKARFMPTALNASRLACIAFVIPFFFAYNPVILLGVQPFTAMFFPVFLFTVLGAIILSMGLFGYSLTKLNWFERILLIGAALIMIYPEMLTSFIGLAIFAADLLWQKKRTSRMTVSTSREE